MSRFLTAVLGATLVAAVVASAPAHSAVPPHDVVSYQTLTAPDSGATNFGNSAAPFTSVPRSAAMDAFRAVVPADLDGGRVAYVYNRAAATGDWSHTGTIEAPADASSSWGDSVSVHGPTIAIADRRVVVAGQFDENYGRVHIYDVDLGGQWVESQVLSLPGRFRLFAGDVWLGSDALIVRESIYCDGSCSAGRWYQYERNAGGDFVETSSDFGVSNHMVVGVDRSRIVVGTPGFSDPFGCDPVDSRLRVVETATNPAADLLSLSEANTTFCGPSEPYFRNVDINGDVVVWESCCEGAAGLEIRRFDGLQYQPEQTVGVGSLSDGIAAIPNGILRASVDEAKFTSLLFDGIQWVPGSDVAMPSDVVSRTPVLAAANRVAVVGDEALHILDFELPIMCFGQPVTVDIGQGETPTSGDDVIFGTPFADVIDAGDGNDLVCGFGGDDMIDAGGGNDIVLGGPGDDRINGEGGGDLIGGGPGNDVIRGGALGDFIVGQAGDDDLFGEGGDDLIGGGDGSDDLDGGLGADLCHGGAQTDTAVDCEIVGAVP